MNFQFGLSIVLLLAVTAPITAQMKGDIVKWNIPPSSDRLPTLKNVGVDQRLDVQVPLDLQFHDETGKSVRLGDYFGKRPVILNLAYFGCTMLCGEVQSGIIGSLRALQFNPSTDFDIVTVSFDPRETPEQAAAKKASLLLRYHRPGAEEGWHFLTGDQHNIEALTKSVGFDYQYDATLNQWAHAAAIIVLTPKGKISKYFYGVEFAPKDLRFGLIEASESKIGTVVDQILLYCYHYNPATGKYGAVIMNVLRLAGVATVLILGGLVLILFRRDPSFQAHAERIG
ncbi:MAG TPA: SCO family protein [Candidatus Angelobacter sp.]|nr:SCO family protein [Candidatus Angelobacter sp.]